jgi:hypothetical protein
MRSAATVSRFGTSVVGLALGVSAACAAPACGTFSSTDTSDPGDSATGAIDATGASEGGGADALANDAGCTASRACGCVVGADFCADFEGTTAVEEWELKAEENGGTLSFVASDRSPPHGLQATTSARAADGGLFGATAKAVVSKTFVGADIAKISLAFDIAAPTVPCAKDSDATYLVSLFPTGGVGVTVLLQTKTGPMIYVKGGTDQYTSLKAFTNTKTWTHVTIEASNGTLAVGYDGVPAAAPIPFTVTSSGLALALGLTNEPAATDCTVSYDNVVLRFNP